MTHEMLRPVLSDDSRGRDTLFRQFMFDHGMRLHRFVLRRVGDDTEAAEIAQQALVEAALNLKGFRGESRLSTWIFGIAANLVRQHLGRSPQRRYFFESAEVLADHESPAANPCDVLAARQTLALLQEAVDELPASMSQALRLVSIEGLSYEEAADRMGVRVGTVRSRVFRARDAVRDRLRGA